VVALSPAVALGGGRGPGCGRRRWGRRERTGSPARSAGCLPCPAGRCGWRKQETEAVRHLQRRPRHGGQQRSESRRRRLGREGVKVKYTETDGATGSSCGAGTCGTARRCCSAKPRRPPPIRLRWASPGLPPGAPCGGRTDHQAPASKNARIITGNQSILDQLMKRRWAQPQSARCHCSAVSSRSA
jgi:hypothetical protein